MREARPNFSLPRRAAASDRAAAAAVADVVGFPGEGRRPRVEAVQLGEGGGEARRPRRRRRRITRVLRRRGAAAAFEQLLALHPILDTSDRYRFCFGIHYEITPALPLKTIVAKISKLIKTLPSKLYAPP